MSQNITIDTGKVKRTRIDNSSVIRLLHLYQDFLGELEEEAQPHKYSLVGFMAWVNKKYNNNEL